MIDTVIKRDGREEPFQPGKMMRWAEWAAKRLNGRVDWQKGLRKAISRAGPVVTSAQLQNLLIEAFLEEENWSSYLMAGCLYAALRAKEIYGDAHPSIKALHQSLQQKGIMRHLDYSDEEYAELEEYIDHQFDYLNPHFAAQYTNDKYTLQNKVTGEVYETPQFVYMRMSMVIYEHRPKEQRMALIKGIFDHFRNKRLSAPTPNYICLGLTTMGLASCCLYTTGDTRQSLAIGDFIANTMTAAGAGIGANIACRDIGEEVRGGTIKHLGKLPYYRSAARSIMANMKGTRAGAGNISWRPFDREAETIVQLRNPRALESARIRELHYTMQLNAFLLDKALAGEKIFSFSMKTAPDLYEAFYSKDLNDFVKLYRKYEADATFFKRWIPIADLVVQMETEALETGTAYRANIDEINRHTPFKEPIRNSNLCIEVVQPTSAYYDMKDLYLEEDHGRGEISVCNLFAVNVGEEMSSAVYRDVCYHGLNMVDFTIDHTDYDFPHLAYTAKARRNAAGGIMGLATHMARNKLRYDTHSGRQELHFVAERHMYHMIEASLMIASERGVAPWIHKTRWPEGWLPLDTYNRNVDSIGEFENIYPWEKLRPRIVAMGGLAHSALVGYMPGESSSKALGTCNGPYQIRKLVISKTDGETKIRWAAPYGDDPNYSYHLAFDTNWLDQIKSYAVMQKWCDQSISADEYACIDTEEKIPSTSLLRIAAVSSLYGMKGRYYKNSQITQGIPLSSAGSVFDANHAKRTIEIIAEGAACAGGACSL